MITMVTGQVGSATGRVASATGPVGTLTGHRITAMTQERMTVRVRTTMQMKTTKWTMTKRRKKISLTNYRNSKWKRTRKLW